MIVKEKITKIQIVYRKYNNISGIQQDKKDIDQSQMPIIEVLMLLSLYLT